MFKLSEKRRVLEDFEANKRNQKQTFHQVQRFLWEKSLFPERFPPCSVFLCASCNCKTRDLSFCLQCGRCFCGSHFGDHRCQPGYGVDVLSHQLFLFSPELGRRFIFNSSIDRLILSAKLAVIDGLPFDADLDPSEPVLPVLIPPMPLQNLGNTCWLNALMQCLVVNPLLQKWFLSGQVDVTQIDCPEAAVHCHMQQFFLAQMRKELDELKAERAAAKDAATKKELLDSVEKGLKDKLKAAGIEANGYFIKQVKKELEIPKSDGDTSPDVDELVGKAEKAYFKSLKEAGLEATASPQGGRKNGKGGSSAVDAYFKKKGLKEGWKK